MSFAHYFRIAVVALSSSLFMTSVGAGCPECQDEQCVPITGPCACVPRIGCVISIPTGGTPPGSLAPVSPIPLPPPIQSEVDKLDKGASRSVEKLSDDTFTTFQKAGDDTIRTLQKAGGDTFTTIQKAGEDGIKTTYKAANDATATHVKAWRDIGEQGKRSFNHWQNRSFESNRFTQECYPGNNMGFQRQHHCQS